MGICSDEDFEKELGRLTTVVDNTVDDTTKPISKGITGEGNVTGEIIDIHRGRGEGNNGAPESLRKIIGEESVLSGRQGSLGLARAFGVSDSSASAYANGATSTASYDKPNATLRNHVDNARRRVARTARQKLSLALSKITPEKLDDVKARDLAGIAKDMSAVIKNTEPSVPEGPRSDGPTFVIYAPQFRREESFDVVHVNE